MNNINLIRNNTYPSDVIFIDGHCSSGKIILSRLLECYKGVEKSKEDYSFYYILSLYRLGKISEDVAITLLKSETDRRLYELYIGRDINFRLTDGTSFTKYPYPLDYIKRIFRGEREKINEEIINNKPIFQNMKANALTDINILLKSFDKRLKLIYIKRNPLDVINAIYKRGFGDRIGVDPSTIELTYDWKGYTIPIYAIDWEVDYLKMKPIDRVVKMVYNLEKSDMQAYNNLNNKDKQKVYFIDFDSFITNPYPICNELEKFIGRDIHKRYKRILKKEKCPRNIDSSERSNIRNNIRNIASENSIELIKEMENDYRY